MDGYNDSYDGDSYGYADYYYSPTEHASQASQSKGSAYDAMAAVRIFTVIIYSITCLLGLLGNGLVIAIITLKMKKSVNTIWFLNLATADFLFNIFLPLTITYTALDFHWVFGRPMCKVNSLLLNLNMYTSVFLLTAISVDRCILVIFPVWSQNNRGPKTACLVCTLLWVLGFLMSSPALVFRDTAQNKANVICFNNYSLSRSNNSSPLHQDLGNMWHAAVNIVRFLIGFIVPMTVITGCYVIIILRVKRNRLAKSKKTLRIIIAIIMTFFLCWCPYHVVNLMEIHHYSIPTQVFKIGAPLATALAVSNSCMNPILYVFMGQDFKKFRMTILSRLVNALSEDTAHSTLPHKSLTKGSSVTEKEMTVSSAMCMPIMIYNVPPETTTAFNEA